MNEAGPSTAFGEPVPEGRSWSLFIRLGWITTAAVVVSLVFGGFAMFWAASIQNEQMLDARLEQFGATLQALVDDAVAEHGSGALLSLPQLKTRPTATLLYRYQVWTRHGSLLLRSHEAPATRPLADRQHFGYARTHIEGEEYRVFALPSRDGEHVIQVAENINEAWSQVGAVTVYYAAFLLVPFGLVIAATWWMLRRALRTLHHLAEGLEHRNPLDVKPLSVVEPPRELVPIVRSLHSLLARMQRALSIERSFTGMAAHEMRTPLAGVRAQAQLLTQSELPGDSGEVVDSLISGVDRASHVLAQLLDLARVESVAMTGMPVEPVDLQEIYEEVMRDLVRRARKRGVVVDSRLSGGTIEGHAFGLSVLMRNLLANAILYSPRGGRVEVSSESDERGLVLRVDDSGPGIPPADREKAFERFQRLGRTKSDGAGLGLAIVLLVVELHHARIRLLESPWGGLRVEVRFGIR